MLQRDTIDGIEMADEQILFSLREDRYEGVNIDGFGLTCKGDEFESALDTLLQNLEGKRLLWIKLPIEHSTFIPILTQRGFVFHHCNEKDITLVKALVEEPIIPTAKNHTLGVGVLVLYENKLLVVKDRINQTYKLPGGFIDDDEIISQAVRREVFEETGIEVEFESVVSLGHFTPAQFGESNLYVITVAKALSTVISIQDSEEIIEARWIDVNEYLQREDVLAYNKALVKNGIAHGKGLKKSLNDTLITKENLRYELFF
jgi:8-oxo-dGTP diphosphatase